MYLPALPALFGTLHWTAGSRALAGDPVGCHLRGAHGGAALDARRATRDPRGRGARIRGGQGSKMDEAMRYYLDLKKGVWLEVP